VKRIVTDFFMVFVLSLGTSTCLVAQNLSADRFLEGVSAHPVGDQVEKDQSGAVYRDLNSASPTAVERLLPVVLQYTRRGNEVHARAYAAMFLTSIAIRPDGAALLASRSEEISGLITDANPAIQRLALATTDYVMAKAGTGKQHYVSALEVAIARTQTPQDVALGMVEPLLSVRAEDPNAVKPVIDFIHRDDLTADTRKELVHSLGNVDGLPEEINQQLSKELDDPDPTVRVSALVAFADSTTRFHTLAKDRVERMANDPQENPKIRDLAKEAIAGKTNLNPNVLVPNVEIPADKPNDH
jgi:hypothetical protein